jgi:uncharacterized protein YggE
MQVQQAIVAPFGISVFGSAIVRVTPDVVVLRFLVSQIKQHPREAFQAVRESAQQVQTFLSNARLNDAGSSHIGLKEEYRYVQSEQKFVGYRTQVEFRVIISDLSRVEEILAGVVDAGANNILAVDFQTTRLKEIRAEARRQAIAAAREKAEVYCTAAGVELGEVIHIEDLNPDQRQRYEGHTRLETPLEDEGEAKTFDPSSIVIAGTVMVAFKIHGQSSTTLKWGVGRIKGKRNQEHEQGSMGRRVDRVGEGSGRKQSA